MKKRTIKSFKKLYRELDQENNKDYRTRVIPDNKKKTSKNACKKFNFRNQKDLDKAMEDDI